MRSFAIEDPGSPDPPLYATLREVALKRALHRGGVDDQLAAVSATSLAPDLNFPVILTYYMVEHYR